MTDRRHGEIDGQAPLRCVRPETLWCGPLPALERASDQGAGRGFNGMEQRAVVEEAADGF